LASELHDEYVRKLGGSFWVAERSYVADYYIPDVRTLQQGLGLLADKIDEMGWRAPRIGGSPRI
jgi:hypothetical protein